MAQALDLIARLGPVRRIAAGLQATLGRAPAGYASARDHAADVERAVEYKSANARGEIARLEHERASLASRVEALEAELRSRPARPDPTFPHIIYSPMKELGWQALRVLSLLKPMDVVGRRYVRKGRPHDGGYVMLDHALSTSVVYSCGINDDVSWDLDMAALGCQVYQFDHTIDALPVQHPNFHWSKLAIMPKSEPGATSLADAIAQNGHGDRDDLILKMDIEDAEWDVLGALDDKVLSQFSQIVIELHRLGSVDYFRPPAHTERFAKIVPVLMKLNRTHQPVNLHGNNWGGLCLVGGVMMPDVVEVTYVRRRDHEFVESRKCYPTELDMPCRADAPDFHLGPIGMLPSFA